MVWFVVMISPQHGICDAGSGLGCGVWAVLAVSIELEFFVTNESLLHPKPYSLDAGHVMILRQ